MSNPVIRNPVDAALIRTQAAHGFTVGQPLCKSGATYALAQANALNTGAIVVVAEVIDVNTFRIARDGEVVGGITGATPGDTVYTAESAAGGLVSGSAPEAGSVIDNPLGTVETATTYTYYRLRAAAL